MVSSTNFRVGRVLLFLFFTFPMDTKSIYCEAKFFFVFMFFSFSFLQILAGGETSRFVNNVLVFLGFLLHFRFY